MTKAMYLGVWMDHASAHLMEYDTDHIETKIIESKFIHETKEEAFSKSESLMHNKERHQQASYYKQLAEVIKDYKGVVLFGPTDAKTELLNIMQADRHFEKIKIEVKDAPKMTNAQQHAYVKNHFSVGYLEPISK
ncbi:MAG: hypothetical protein WCG87_09065 [Bacteroidota bacterium]